MYDVLFSGSAKKQLGKLEKHIQQRILSAVERVRIRPFHFVRRMVGEPYFRLRVGEYRIILDIKGDKMVIMVVHIGHRKTVYKRLYQ